MDWINLNDKKPDSDDLVLLLTDNNEPIVGRITPEGIISGNECVAWDWAWNHDINTVTHWMRISEPPTTKGEITWKR
jgi:hypothetical protein